jgi:hypothetical protein
LLKSKENSGAVEVVKLHVALPENPANLLPATSAKAVLATSI